MTRFEELLLFLLINYFRFKIDESRISNGLKADYEEFTNKFVKELKELRNNK